MWVFWQNQGPWPASCPRRPDQHPHHSGSRHSQHSQSCTFVVGHVDVEGGGHGPQPRLVQQLQLLAEIGGANHLCSSRGWEPTAIGAHAELL